jgi:hypothetical protein
MANRDGHRRFGNIRKLPSGLPELSVSVRRGVRAPGGIVTQLVTHARLGERMMIACLQRACTLRHTAADLGNLGL